MEEDLKLASYVTDKSRFRSLTGGEDSSLTEERPSVRFLSRVDSSHLQIARNSVSRFVRYFRKAYLRLVFAQLQLEARSRVSEGRIHFKEKPLKATASFAEGEWFDGRRFWLTSDFGQVMYLGKRSFEINNVTARQFFARDPISQ